MGSWGTAISSNDTYADVYSDFFDNYNKGLSVNEVSVKLIANNQETINDSGDSNNFWFALAKAQWECKQLDPIVFEHVKRIINSGSDIEIWMQLGATQKNIDKRKIVLDKFLAAIQTERPKAKPRKKKIIIQPVFEKGDCLAFRLENGNYGGAIVLEAVRDAEHGLNLIACTRINQPNKPTNSDFENSEVLVLNHKAWDDKPNICWYFPIHHHEIESLIEKVGAVKVSTIYNFKDYKFRFIAHFEVAFIKQVGFQFQSEKEKPGSLVKLSVGELLGK